MTVAGATAELPTSPPRDNAGDVYVGKDDLDVADHKEHVSVYPELSNTADSVVALHKSITESDDTVTQATDHAERSWMTASSSPVVQDRLTATCRTKSNQSILAVQQPISMLRL